MSKPTYLVIKIAADYVAEEGTAFDAVVAALDHFDIPATIYCDEQPALADLLTRGV